MAWGGARQDPLPDRALPSWSFSASSLPERPVGDLEECSEWIGKLAHTGLCDEVRLVVAGGPLLQQGSGLDSGFPACRALATDAPSCIPGRASGGSACPRQLGRGGPDSAGRQGAGGSGSALCGTGGFSSVVERGCDSLVSSPGQACGSSRSSAGRASVTPECSGSPRGVSDLCAGALRVLESSAIGGWRSVISKAEPPFRAAQLPAASPSTSCRKSCCKIWMRCGGREYPSVSPLCVQGPCHTPPAFLPAPPPQPSCGGEAIRAAAPTGPPASLAPGGWGFSWTEVQKCLPQMVSQVPSARR